MSPTTRSQRSHRHGEAPAEGRDDHLPQIVLVHGINSRGDWQRAVARLAGAWFDCRRVRYREYHWRGEVKLFYWPWGLVLGAALLALSIPSVTLPALWALFLFAGLGVALAEYDWSSARLHPPQPPGYGEGPDWRRGVRALGPLGLLLAGPACLAGFADAADRVVILLVGLAAATGFLEFREAAYAGPPDPRRPDRRVQLRAWWRAVVPAVVALGGWFVVQDQGTTGQLVVQLLLACYSGLVEPELRWWAALRKVREQILAATGDRQARPHLIAHSLGSLLCSELFRRPRGRFWDRALLVGCVVSDRFNWRRLIPPAGDVVRHVRNEHGRMDWVSCLAARGAWLRPWRGLGQAGISGFLGRAEYETHWVDVPSLGCLRCGTNGPAFLHNVSLDYYWHSDVFPHLTDGSKGGEVLTEHLHARGFWLPYFWRIDPAVWSRFVECCEQRKTAELERLALPVPDSGTGIPVASVRSYVEDVLLARPEVANSRLPRAEAAARFDRLRARALELTRTCVREALAQFLSEAPEYKTLRQLEPTIAVRRAVEAAMRIEAGS